MGLLLSLLRCWAHLAVNTAPSWGWHDVFPTRHGVWPRSLSPLPQHVGCHPKNQNPTQSTFPPNPKKIAFQHPPLFPRPPQPLESLPPFAIIVGAITAMGGIQYMVHHAYEAGPRCTLNVDPLSLKAPVFNLPEMCV